MGYSSAGKRPFEFASKASHPHVINDAEVQKTIESLWIPKPQSQAAVKDLAIPFLQPQKNAVDTIVAVDGGGTKRSAAGGVFPSPSPIFTRLGGGVSPAGLSLH